MASRIAAVLVLGLAFCNAALVVQQPALLSSSRSSLLRSLSTTPRMMADDEKRPRVNAPNPNQAPGSRRPGPTPNPNEDGIDFEFDATTVTALLGAAIAFQFFVLANL